MGRNLELPIAEPFLAAAELFSSSPPPSTTAASFRLLNASKAELPAARRSTEACFRISMGPASSSRGSLPVPGPKACSPLTVEDESRGESRGGVRLPICIRRRPIVDGAGVGTRAGGLRAACCCSCRLPPGRETADVTIRRALVVDARSATAGGIFANKKKLFFFSPSSPSPKFF